MQQKNHNQADDNLQGLKQMKFALPHPHSAIKWKRPHSTIKQKMPHYTTKQKGGATLTTINQSFLTISIGYQTQSDVPWHAAITLQCLDKCLHFFCLLCFFQQ